MPSAFRQFRYFWVIRKCKKKAPAEIRFRRGKGHPDRKLGHGLNTLPGFKQNITPMQLTLTKSTIRSFHPDDAASAARHIGTLSVARNMNLIPHPYTLKDAEEWIAHATSKTPETHFAIAVGNEVVGGIGIVTNSVAAMQHSAELGYWLGETFWGQGIMSEAVAAFTDWAFANFDLARLHASVYARNPASARVLEKAGYECEGREKARYFKDGEFIDGLMYARLRL